MKKSTAFVGDSHARSAIIGKSSNLFDYCQGSSALPVHDQETKNILDRCCNKYDLVFWSCSTELNGAKNYQFMMDLKLLPVEKRFYSFPFNQRWWVGEIFSKEMKQFQRISLLSLYLEQVEYFMSTFSNIILVPLTAKFLLEKELENFLKIPSTYSILRKKYGVKCANLDEMKINKDTFIDKYLHLSSVGYESLLELLIK